MAYQQHLAILPANWDAKYQTGIFPIALASPLAELSGMGFALEI